MAMDTTELPSGVGDFPETLAAPDRRRLRESTFAKRSSPLVAFLFGLLIVGIGVLDWWTGTEVSLALLYLVPVASSGWLLGKNQALVLAVIAAATWFAADYVLHDPGYFPISLWNGVTRFGIFGGMGVVMAMLRKEREQLCASLDRLSRFYDREEKNVRTDALTGLHNSWSFFEALEREWARFIRLGEPVSLAFIGVDNFRSVNDKLGHAMADTLLRQLSTSLVESVRKEDFTGRLGGDQFAVLLPGVGVDEARRVVERYQDRVTVIAEEYPGFDLGVSVGIAGACKAFDCSRTFLRAADDAMYQVKASGKSGVAVDYCNEGRLTVLRPSQSASSPAEDPTDMNHSS